MSIMQRLAGAPISWGVCEVPGWGIELSPDRVLGEMQQLGLSATELGSDGYLPTDPAELKDLCQQYDLTMIGGFVPVVIHEPSEVQATIDATHRAAKLMSAAGGTLFVSSPVTDWNWGPRRDLDSSDWQHGAKMLSVIDDILGEYGMTHAMHPHLRTSWKRATTSLMCSNTPMLAGPSTWATCRSEAWIQWNSSTVHSTGSSTSTSKMS